MAAYHFTVALPERFSSAVARTRRALEEQGFGIVSEVDMTALFEERVGAGRLPHVIFGARADGRDPASTERLPCHVVVRSTQDDGVVIDLMDPAVTIDLARGDRKLGLSDELMARYEMVRQAVTLTPAAVL